MKAMRVQKFGLDIPMRLDEVEEPAPAPGEILVRVRAAGVNPIDIGVRSGTHLHSHKSTPPYIPGNEVSGEVLGRGEGVEGFRAGQRVFGMASGGYAELATLPADTALELPARYSWSEGAGIKTPFYTAWNALVIKLRLGPGETVLVHGGAGGVGMAAIQLAKRMGCRVLTTVSSAEKADFCRRLGADEVIDYRKEDFAARCLELTEGKGVDSILDLAAADNLNKDLGAIRVRGRIVVIGPGTGKEPDTRISIYEMMRKDARVFGMTGSNFDARVEAVRRFAPLLAEGTFRVHVGAEFPLAEANDAHELMLSGKFLGKIVLLP